MSIKISVVVSMYNIELFIEECIKSLVAQSFKDMEILLVDDGSSDGTYEIARRYAELHAHITLIHQPNAGLSSARNLGLSHARGEYIAFVDGDDYMLPNMFELMYQSACENNSDMVMIGFMRLLEDGTLNIDRELTGQGLFSNYPCIRGKVQIQQQVLAAMIGVLPEAEIDVELNSCVWRNLYRKQVLEEAGIVFKSEKEYISEDILFHVELLPHLTIISTVNQPAYIYRFNQNSLTKKYRPERFQKECFLYQTLIQKASENPLLDKVDLRLKRSFIGRVRNCILSEIYANKGETLWKKLQNIKNMLKSDLVRNVLNDYPIHKLNLKLKVYTRLMKYNQGMGLIMLGLLNKKRYLNK